MNSLVGAVIGFACECLKSSDNAHGVTHATKTAKYARIIAEKENADVNLCVIAAWLHDISRSREWKEETPEENHGIDGSIRAKQFLLSLGMDESEVEEVCEAISTHCFPGIQKTDIAKILWDADKLNVFSKEMEKEYLDYWVNNGFSREEAGLQIIKCREFYAKTFNTKTAKELASSTTLD